MEEELNDTNIVLLAFNLSTLSARVQKYESIQDSSCRGIRDDISKRLHCNIVCKKPLASYSITASILNWLLNIYNFYKYLHWLSIIQNISILVL